MAEELQNLLEKIKRDGVEKANAEAAAIVAKAKSDAAAIVKTAQDEAAAAKAAAAEDAQENAARAEETIRQAARDTVISLKTDLLSRLNAVVKNCVGEAMTPEVMEQIILKMAEAYGKSTESAESLEILLPKKEQEQAEAFLKSRLLAELKANPEINLTNEFNSGLQIAFRGTEVYFDFSDDALSEVLCRFVGPKLTSVIKG